MHKKTGIVISLLVLIVAIIVLFGMKMGNCCPDCKVRQVEANIIALNTALDEFKMYAGFYPDTTNGLRYLVEDCGMANWEGPFLVKKTLPKDSWGHDFHYDLVNGIPIVISVGKDGKLGTRDDFETSRRAELSKTSLRVDHT